MTKDELKEKIDNYLGIESTYNTDGWATQLVYKSPTGIKLFELTISEGRSGGWQFGGNTNAVPDNWEELCHIHEERLE